MELGIILVLFILLVIIAQIFCSSERDNYESSNARDFIVFNQTNFNLTTTKLDGEFESPVPRPHTIYPGHGYSFTVVTKYLQHSNASAYYNIISLPDVLIVGAIHITFKEYTDPVGRSNPSTSVNFYGPINPENGDTWVTIR
ncbi:hypothetical protein M3223_01725 [Paenibacillus pasadenensis]|uniref:hypothetical protein n=1 Tax=Paenibacillus pasadenensis TaxID=217090 RepID=UPI00203C7058|nr:hypothetical protein [Paenibacillus pasadenensis]MCM3746067.1 hypothetical protein [Paenibacillus pasadenensis]